MAFLDSLPFDVIDYILNCECISFVDICRFACVSRIFNSIASSNTLWKKKYKQMWPDLAVFYGASSTDWRNQFKRQYGYRNLVFKILSGLSSELYHVENISDESFSCLKEIVQQDELGYQIIITELENILYDSNSHLNLTHKYYAKKALRYVRHEQLKILLQQYLSQPANELSLMEGACLISQWLQPTNSKCTVHVSSQITDIATRVLETVKQNCPNHPVVEHGLTDGILTQSLWTSSECKQILCYINAVMFKDMKFCVIDTIILDYMWYTFIDQVLNKKKGHNIILGIIYAAVAGKLGVSCAPVNYSRFILKWQDHTQSLGKKGAYALIDISESSSLNNKLIDLTQLIPGDELLSIDLTNAVHPVKVFERLVQIPLEIMLELQNVEEDNAFSMCDVLLLLCLFNPENIEIKFLLTGLYSQLGINATEAISILQKMAEHDPPITHEYRYQSTLLTLENMKTTHPSVKQNFRIREHASKHVKFAVGMIMRHKKYNYRCVIYGWDPTCKASIHWIRQMGVYNLARKDKQPFYHVLVSDGTNRYAAEENLENDKENMPIEHIHVGRYFESFNDSYYLPNEQTELEYPDDKKVREKVLCSVQNG